MNRLSIAQSSPESLAIEWFRQSQGMWHSQRRYYTLNPEVGTQEVVSLITVQTLDPGSSQLLELARLHGLEDERSLCGGSYVTWESNYTDKIRKPSSGSTIFGVKDDLLYRDRGFATADPITATYRLSNPQTLCLRTEYKGSVFEEELKLIGSRYRTRQTIISRSGQEIMIGQYLETRMD